MTILHFPYTLEACSLLHSCFASFLPKQVEERPHAVITMMLLQCSNACDDYIVFHVEGQVIICLTIMAAMFTSLRKVNGKQWKDTFLEVVGTSSLTCLSIVTDPSTSFPIALLTSIDGVPILCHI